MNRFFATYPFGFLNYPVLRFQVLVWLIGVLFSSPGYGDVEAVSSTIGLGGGQSTSANYSIQATIGGVAPGFSSSTNYLNKAGFQGQQYTIESLQISGTPDPAIEASDLQLIATGVADDQTEIHIDPSQVSWAAVDGPITLIDSNGLSSLGNVFEDSAVQYQGDYAGLTASLTLTVLNVGTDDFGLYASDGLADSWQVQFFGLSNPDAAPTSDPDRDLQSNAEEELAGFDPTDPRSFFLVTITDFSMTNAAFSINRVLPGNDYVLEWKLDISDAEEDWKPVTTLTPGSPEDDAAIQDTTNTGPTRFYRVVVSKTVD